MGPYHDQILSLNWRYATKAFDAARRFPTRISAPSLEAARLAPSLVRHRGVKFVVENAELRGKIQAVAFGQTGVWTHHPSSWPAARTRDATIAKETVDHYREDTGASTCRRSASPTDARPVRSQAARIPNSTPGSVPQAISARDDAWTTACSASTPAWVGAGSHRRGPNPGLPRPGPQGRCGLPQLPQAGVRAARRPGMHRIEEAVAFVEMRPPQTVVFIPTNSCGSASETHIGRRQRPKRRTEHLRCGAEPSGKPRAAKLRGLSKRTRNPGTAKPASARIVHWCDSRL